VAFPSEYLAILSMVPGVSWSDQLSFWREGYHALMVTDTAFYRYPYYHTVRDTPNQLDYTSMAKVVKGLTGSLIELANGEEELGLITKTVINFSTVWYNFSAIFCIQVPGRNCIL
jgi:hypothetical protein